MHLTRANTRLSLETVEAFPLNLLNIPKFSHWNSLVSISLCGQHDKRVENDKMPDPNRSPRISAMTSLFHFPIFFRGKSANCSFLWHALFFEIQPHRFTSESPTALIWPLLNCIYCIFNVTQTPTSTDYTQSCSKHFTHVRSKQKTQLKNLQKLSTTNIFILFSIWAWKWSLRELTKI